MAKDHPFRLSLGLRPRRRMGGAIFIVAALFTHTLTESPSAKAMQVAMNPSIAGKYSGDPSSDMAPSSKREKAKSVHRTGSSKATAEQHP